MTLSLDGNTANYQIRAYQPGTIKINEKIYTKSVLLEPEWLMEDWVPQRLDELKKEHLAIVVQRKPAIYLLGVGETMQFPPLTIYGDLMNQGIGVEVMTTGAACRTFNALAAEGRRVMVGLIIS